MYIEVLKLYEDATPPKFIFKNPSPDKLILEYKSKRKLCLFAKGLIVGVADHYNHPIEYKQIKCLHNDDESCIFELKFRIQE